MVDVERIDHVAIAVWRIRDVVPLYKDLLGGEFVDAGDDLEKEFRWVHFRYPGGFKIELMEPLSEDSFLVRFLEKRGPGMHHILIHVKGIESAIEQSERAGYRVVEARLQDKGWNEAFLHPKSTCGVLIEFGEVKHSDGEPVTEEDYAFPYTLEEVLNGALGGPPT